MEKLPTEVIIRLLEGALKSLPVENKIALLSHADLNIISSEYLKKQHLLEAFIVADISLYIALGYDDKVIEFFNKHLSDSYALENCVKTVYNVDKRPIKKSKIKQHILDTLIGPEWRKPNFYILGGRGCATYVRCIINNTNRPTKKDVDSLLCKGLVVFDEIPKSRLNKFFDALRRLMPYFKRIIIPQDYRNKYNFHAVSAKNVNIIHYDIAGVRHKRLPFGLTKKMYIQWYIENTYLKVMKTLYVSKTSKHQTKKFQSIIKYLLTHYPKQMRRAEITDDTIIWREEINYPLPDDLKELSEFWDELV